jgi:hypothetical protein
MDRRNPERARLNVALQRRPTKRRIKEYQAPANYFLINPRLRIAGAVGEGAPLLWQNAAPAKGL